MCQRGRHVAGRLGRGGFIATAASVDSVFCFFAAGFAAAFAAEDVGFEGFVAAMAAFAVFFWCSAILRCPSRFSWRRACLVLDLDMMW